MWFLLQVVGQFHKKMSGTGKAKLKDDLARACSTSGSRKNSSPLPSTFSHYTTDFWRDFWVAAMVWNMVLDDLVRVGVQKALLTIQRGLPGSKACFHHTQGHGKGAEIVGGPSGPSFRMSLLLGRETSESPLI